MKSGAKRKIAKKNGQIDYTKKVVISTLKGSFDGSQIHDYKEELIKALTGKYMKV
ncbi:hypothetical protein [Dyadobacter sp. 3J3]|uniref:hypothetical protein n=1 Tax=Dyadobacter sp. 3J3 TaxID=2606600 RepID=UPI0013588298|nr:hypothetical protein [Dyadobacter sp. 3J3]